jgi:TetR/AcrR family transcriptional regulator, transcriptional repressor for nem operon
MKVTREQAAQNRERIVQVAADRFRERGFEGIGVADLMREAGLTHGGFYGHFGSKEDLMAEACTRAVERSRELWRKRTAAHPEDPLGELARLYLTPRHRDNPAQGCVMASLAAEASRQGPAVRGAITEGLRTAFDFLAGLIPARNAEAKRRKAIHAYASWVGAMVLARAADDEALSREILEAVASESAARQPRRRPTSA